MRTASWGTHWQGVHLVREVDMITKSEMVSRRKALSLIGSVAAFGLATVPAVLTVSDAEAQTVGMQRRQERREGRHQRRDDRRTGRREVIRSLGRLSPVGCAIQDPDPLATETSSGKDRTCLFSITPWRWALMVRSVAKARPICLLVRPRMIRSKTSRSCGVRSRRGPERTPVCSVVRVMFGDVQTPV